MDASSISVQELTHNDIIPITNYWLKSDPAFLKGMGVDISKIPSADEWKTMLCEQLSQPIHEKKS